jgi:hypothetical protein
MKPLVVRDAGGKIFQVTFYRVAGTGSHRHLSLYKVREGWLVLKGNLVQIITAML